MSAYESVVETIAHDVRTEFRKLYRRIQNLLPRKLRYPPRVDR